MTLLKQTSERLDDKGKPFIDLYLGWSHEGKVYLVRVRPQFCKDCKLTYATAREVPVGESLDKYVD